MTLYILSQICKTARLWWRVSICDRQEVQEYY